MLNRPPIVLSDCYVIYIRVADWSIALSVTHHHYLVSYLEWEKKAGKGALNNQCNSFHEFKSTLYAFVDSFFSHCDNQ